MKIGSAAIFFGVVVVTLENSASENNKFYGSKINKTHNQSSAGRIAVGDFHVNLKILNSKY